MSLINKFLQIILCLSLALLVFCFTLVGVFKSNQQLTQTLDKADFYSAAAKIMAEQINAQLTGDEKVVAVAKQSIESDISSGLARTTLQPLQITLITWLSSEEDNLKLELDLQAIKTKITSSVSDSQLKFSLTKLIPDHLDLASSDSVNAEDLSLLKRIKSAYQLAEKSIPVLALIVIGSAVALFVLNIRRGSRKLTSFLYPAATASVIGLITVGLSYPIEGMISINAKSAQPELGMNVSIRLLLAVIQQTTWAFIIIGLLSISGIIIARLIFKKRDKKLKDKKK